MLLLIHAIFVHDSHVLLLIIPQLEIDLDLSRLKCGTKLVALTLSKHNDN